MLKVTKVKLVNASIIVLAASALWAVYILQIAETNAYRGYATDYLTVGSMAASFLMVLGVALVMPSKIRRPSDFFLLFHSIVVLLSCSLFCQITGLLDTLDAIILYLAMMVPVAFTVLIRKVGIRININGLAGNSTIYYLLIVIVILAVTVGISKTSDTGFDWASMYSRRLAGRESIGSRNITAYLLSISINGVGPYLAFIGACRKNVIFGTCGILVGIFAFWLLGLKLPFFMVLIFLGIGSFYRRRKLASIPTIAVTAIATTALVAVFEILAFKHSFVAEFIIRRAFVVQGAVQSYFVDLLMAATNQSTSTILIGVDPAGFDSVTFRVGAEYLGSIESNTNTNAFLFALTNSGAIGFFLACLLVALFFAFTDSCYRYSKRADLYFVAGIYAILITEKAFTTTLVSSGVGLILIMVLLMRRGSAKHKATVRQQEDRRVPNVLLQ